MRTRRAKDTIKSWLKLGDYPEEFRRFFFQWTLLNLYYNELSKEEEEVQRVLELGRKHEELFDSAKNNAIDLVSTECVGKGKKDNPPNSWVKTASLQLRKALNLDANRICARCRTTKRIGCEKINTESYDFQNMEALMRILYQIRCNLFHGDKTEYNNSEQGERNKFLVRVGNEVLDKILESTVHN